MTTEVLKDDQMPLRPHAFHLNLPSHHISKDDGVPYITKFAQNKARMILKLAHSIQLTENLYINDSMEDVEDDDEDDDDDHAFPDEYTMVSSIVIVRGAVLAHLHVHCCCIHIHVN